MGGSGRKAGMLSRMLSRPVPVEPDPADYGTCIGLEFSLDENPKPPEERDAARPSWVQRLTSRGKPAP